jgi:polar amino acid transport system substrate-binding protein
VQHATALHLGVGENQIEVFGTYLEAVAAVVAGSADAFASMAMAHHGYLERNTSLPLTVVEVPNSEKKADQGAFAFAKSQSRLRGEVDDVLANFLGSTDRRALMNRFGSCLPSAKE